MFGIQLDLNQSSGGSNFGILPNFYFLFFIIAVFYLPTSLPL